MEISNVLLHLGLFPIRDTPSFRSQLRRSWRWSASFWSICQRNMPLMPILGSRPGPSTAPAISGYRACRLFLCFWSSYNVHIHTHTHTHIYIRILKYLCSYISASPCPQLHRVRVPGLRLDTWRLPSRGHLGGWCLGRFMEPLCLAWLYLAAKPCHVGADVDRLAYPLHCPMTCDRQMGEQSFLAGVAPSYRAVVGGHRLSKGYEAPGLDI
jgi:hypothetical protein